jgi:L-fuculose-phosphate aldolase
MMMTQSEFLKQCGESAAKLIEMAGRLHAKNYLAAFDGNLSFRVNSELIAITPTARAKAFIQKEDLALIDLNGETVFGSPSGEKWMHLEVYRTVPRAQAIVHAHPPAAIAWSVAHPNDQFLPVNILSELVLAVGAIPIVPFQIPGTSEMGKSLQQFLPEHQAMILARHGALAWGDSMEEAYFGIERLEHAAIVLSHAKMLGNLSEMGASAFAKLRDMRSKMKPGIY